MVQFCLEMANIHPYILNIIFLLLSGKVCFWCYSGYQSRLCWVNKYLSNKHHHHHEQHYGQTYLCKFKYTRSQLTWFEPTALGIWQSAFLTTRPSEIGQINGIPVDWLRMCCVTNVKFKRKQISSQVCTIFNVRYIHKLTLSEETISVCT